MGAKSRLRREWGCFVFDLKGIWGPAKRWYSLNQFGLLARLLAGVYRSLSRTPAWALGFILSGVGYYEKVKR